MSLFTTTWTTTKNWISSYRAQKLTRQQLSRASSMELQMLTPQKLPTNTSYTPYAEEPSYSYPLTSKPHQKRDYTKGWRFGAINCALSTTVVFLINFIVTIWTSRRDPRAPNTFLDGNCTKVKHLNTGIHLLINILSTIILSSSNYCMQCLSAPTRREIDRAHARGTWLDIGIPSMRNLWRIDPRRTILWLLLGLSSLPLHLFYNSAVFSSVSSNSYNAITVSQSFIDSADCTNCTYPTTRTPGFEPLEYIDGLYTLHAKARNGSLERLEPAECIAQYSALIQSTRRNVFLVASNDNFNSSADNEWLPGSHLYYNSYFYAPTAVGQGSLGVYGWMCSGPDFSPDRCRSDVELIKTSPETWRVGSGNGYPVQYCLSEKAEPHCKLQFSLTIGILVTVLNLFKALLMFYVAFFTEDPLITIGDAIASFLENNDPTTKNMCLLSFKDMKASKSGYRTGPKEYRNEARRWKDVLSKTRRIVTVAMFALAIAIVSVLLNFGLRSLPFQQSKSLRALARLGFGAVDPMVVIIWDVKGMISNSLVANAAQPILSFLYFSYNACFTAMLSGVEWCSYNVHRKGLRLSHTPQGAQRSTYFLQLPYRFALPMMVVSGLLHWFVSQSIFLVAIDFYNELGVYKKDDKVCGFSPIAIIAVIILGCVMTIFLVAVGWVPHKPGIPLAGSCSMAISAACQLKDWTDDSQDVSRKKLLWGVVDAGTNGVGHCAFSSGEVALPGPGKFYAGTRRRKTTAMAG